MMHGTMRGLLEALEAGPEWAFPPRERGDAPGEHMKRVRAYSARVRAEREAAAKLLQGNPNLYFDGMVPLSMSYLVIYNEEGSVPGEPQASLVIALPAGIEEAGAYYPVLHAELKKAGPQARFLAVKRVFERVSGKPLEVVPSYPQARKPRQQGPVTKAAQDQAADWARSDRARAREYWGATRSAGRQRLGAPYGSDGDL